MLVAGSMIGSGIFIVSSIIARQVGSPGWLLVVWIVTGLLNTDSRALVRRTGGDDAEGRRPIRVSSRSILAAVGISLRLDAFPCDSDRHDCSGRSWIRTLHGVLLPWVSESNYIIAPIRFGGYALSLSTAQLVGLALIGFLTFTNTRGLEIGKLIQNVFTTAKTGALLALIVLGIVIGLKSGAGAENFRDFWTVRGDLQDVGAGLTAAAAFGLFVGICVAQDEFFVLCRRMEQHHFYRR